MLEYLRIRNLALIEDMELEFAPGINVLTGETGAGKSFILKALGFLLGDRITAEMVRPGAERAQVEALFLLDNDEFIFKREISAQTGRSRLHINDELKSQENIRALRDRLIIHTSQHAQQMLLHQSFQAKLVESIIADSSLISQRDNLLQIFVDHDKLRNNLRVKYAELSTKRDLLEMQQEEIDKIAPEDGEEERLEEQRTAIRNSAQLFKNCEEALLLLHGENAPGLLDLLMKYEKILLKMATHDSNLLEQVDVVSALREHSNNLAVKLRSPHSHAVGIHDLNKIEERLFALAQLKRKLRKSLPEILTLRKEIIENLSFLDTCALDLSQLDKKEKALTCQLKEIIEKLIQLRRSAALEFTKRLEQELHCLGFSSQLIVIPEFVPQEVRPDLFDETVHFLWAPNPGHPPQPLERVASGGELSRFLLALVSIGPNLPNATYIFDEVDAGVGGLVLNKLADKLKSLAKNKQMLLITHWPQLAVHAEKHFQISKEIRNNLTYTQCTLLNSAQRLTELSRMAGGGMHGEALARYLQT